MFSGLVRSTAVPARMGPEDLREALRRRIAADVLTGLNDKTIGERLR